jgi:DNA-binding NarL/FixJ family response regulator
VHPPSIRDTAGTVKSIPLGIIEPQQLFAPFLYQVLSEAGFSVVFSLQSLLLDELGRNEPTVVFIDIDFIEVDPIRALRQIRQVVPNATICAYTGSATDGWATSCMHAGANCVISKAAAPSEIVGGIQRALRLGSYVDPRFNGDDQLFEDGKARDTGATGTTPIGRTPRAAVDESRLA